MNQTQYLAVYERLKDHYREVVGASVQLSQRTSLIVGGATALVALFAQSIARDAYSPWTLAFISVSALAALYSFITACLVWSSRTGGFPGTLDTVELNELLDMEWDDTLCQLISDQAVAVQAELEVNETRSKWFNRMLPGAVIQVAAALIAAWV